MAARRIVPRRIPALVTCLLAATAGFLSHPNAALPLGGPQPVRVSVAGEVRRPGNYTLPSGSTLSSLLIAAGGFTDNAFPAGANLRRRSARETQQTELRDTADSMLREAGDDAEAQDAAQPVARHLLSLAASGRITVRLAHPRLLKGSPADLPLEEGDVLFVPGRTDSVSVAGAVRAASGSLPYAANLGYRKYVRQAGGYSEDADRDHVFLLRADGTTALLSLGFLSWNPAASRWEVTALAGSVPAVGPGDTIVVLRLPPPGLPPKIARKLPGDLMRAAEIAGGPVLLP